MSLYKDASLVMIPSAYKDGKLYSIRPTDGSGDFTFSRGSNLAATRVDVNGLIEKGRENLLLQSNQFDTTPFSTLNSNVTGGQSGYDGSTDAWELNATSAAGRLYQSIVHSGVLSFSMYAKKGTADGVRVRFDQISDTNVYVDLRDGSVASFGNTINIDIQEVSGGWYRITFAFTGSGMTTFILYPTDGDVTSVAGSIYIQDSQLEQGLVATDYIETGASTAQAGILEDLPRLDYSGGASCPSLLLEPQRSNLVTQSEALSIGTSGSTTEQNTADTTSPEGYYNATKILGSTSYLAKGVGSAFSGNNTTSVFLKHGNDSEVGVYMYDGAYYRVGFDITNGTITATFGGATGTITDYGNGWYRCTIYKSTSANVVEVGIDSLAGYVYTYGWQHEYNASYPTSYIPTYGSAVTRSNDSALGQSISLGNSHTIFFNGELNTIDNNKVFMELITSGGSTSATIRNVIGTLRLYNQIDGNYPLGGIQSTNNKWVMRIDGNAYTLFYNNAGSPASQSGTFATARDMDRINLKGAFTECAAKQVLAFNTALTDSECIALTTL